MRAAIARCDLRAILAMNRAAGSSFRLPLNLLPAPEREAMAVIHALCRALDDAADADMPTAARRLRFDSLVAEVEAALNGSPVSALGRALHAVAAAFPIDRAEIGTLITELRGDIDAPPRGPSVEALRRYCRGVAGAPGLLTLAVLGAREPEARRFGLVLAEAMQMTNILRDTEMDARRGRLYLPREVLAAAGVIWSTPLEATAHPAFPAAHARFAELAAERYGEACRLLRHCDPAKLGLPIAFLILYRDLLGRIRAAGAAGGALPSRPRPGICAMGRALAALLMPGLVGPGRAMPARALTRGA